MCGFTVSAFTFTRSWVSTLRPEISQRLASLLHLAVGHIHRLPLSQTLAMKSADRPIFSLPPLTYSLTSEHSPLCILAFGHRRLSQ